MEFPLMDLPSEVISRHLLKFLSYKDILNFECASHTCHQLIQNNIPVLERHANLSVTVEWANGTKRVTVTPQQRCHFNRPTNDIIFSIKLEVVPNDEEDDKENDQPITIGFNRQRPTTWTEHSLRFTKHISLYEVSILDDFTGDLETVMNTLFDKLLTRVQLTSLTIAECDDADLAMVLDKTGQLQHVECICIDAMNGFTVSHETDAKPTATATTLMKLAKDTKLHEWQISEDCIQGTIPREFFTQPHMEELQTLELVKGSRRRTPDGVEVQFDDALLLAQNQLIRITLFDSTVTLKGLHAYLREYIEEKRDFQFIELALNLDREMNEDMVWAALTGNFEWADREDDYCAPNDKTLSKDIAEDGRRCTVKFVTNDWVRWNFAPLHYSLSGSEVEYDDFFGVDEDDLYDDYERGHHHFFDIDEDEFDDVYDVDEDDIYANDDDA